jgi:hypothetical protein
MVIRCPSCTRRITPVFTRNTVHFEPAAQTPEFQRVSYLRAAWIEVPTGLVCIAMAGASWSREDSVPRASRPCASTAVVRLRLRLRRAVQTSIKNALTPGT